MSGCFPLLEYLVLAVLHEKAPLCGYGVYRALRDLGFTVNEGSVYRVVAKLREAGLIEVVEASNGRLRYGLTRRGFERYCTLRRLIISVLSIGGENNC